MFTLFIRRWPARKRGLEPFEFTAGGRVWQFPADYDRRIADLLRDSSSQTVLTRPGVSA